MTLFLLGMLCGVWVGFGTYVLALKAKQRCLRCNTGTDPEWWQESGGLCGACLADAALPLTQITPKEQAS